MVERRVCTFCGVEIEPGTGRMYIKKDGVTYNFCSSKCFKNLVELGRVPRRVTWTRYYDREKQVRLKSAPAEKPTKKRKAKAAKPKDEKEKAEEPTEKVEAPVETPAEAPAEEPRAEKPASKKAKASKKDEEA